MCVKPESVPSRTTPVRGNVIVRVRVCVCVCHLTLRLQMCVQICSSFRLGGSSVCTGERCPQSAVIKCRRSCSTPSSVMSRRCVRRSSTETRMRGTCSSSRRGHTVLLPIAGREIKFCQSITRPYFNNNDRQSSAQHVEHRTTQERRMFPRRWWRPNRSAVSGSAFVRVLWTYTALWW